MLLMITHTNSACHWFIMIYHYNSHTCFVNQTTIAWLYIILLSLVFSISNNVSLMAGNSSSILPLTIEAPRPISMPILVTALSHASFNSRLQSRSSFGLSGVSSFLNLYNYKTLLHSVNDKRTNNWLIKLARSGIQCSLEPVNTDSEHVSNDHSHKFWLIPKMWLKFRG